MGEIDEEAVGTDQVGADGDKRERSSIEFPYSDLDHGVGIARAIRDRAGMSCEAAQLAAWLDHSAAGGTFRSRLSAARIFGLVVTERGKVSLTDLGRDILEPSKERAARTKAFLNVPLYAALFEQYKGYTLPPAAAIERQAVGLGVSSKQSSRARQMFMKSAIQANFIDPGSGRLAKPTNNGEAVAPTAIEGSSRNKGGGSGDGGGDEPPTERHVLIEGLVDILPELGKPLPIEELADWLRAAEVNLRLIYKTKGRITIRVDDERERKGER